MADFTIVLDELDEAALAAATAVYNSEARAADPGHVDETPRQFLRRIIRHKLDFWVKEWRQANQASRQEAYAKLSPADQAAIDAILAKGGFSGR